MWFGTPAFRWVPPKLAEVLLPLLALACELVVATPSLDRLFRPHGLGLGSYAPLSSGGWLVSEAEALANTGGLPHVRSASMVAIA